MTQPLPTALDQLLLKLLAFAGVPAPTRRYLNFLSGVTYVDNPNFQVNGEVVGLTDVLILPGQQVFNVKAYGAKGDGVTDDTAAIQSAVIAANAVLTAFSGVLPPQAYPGWSPVNLYFPTGAYKVSGSAGQACIELPPMLGVIGDGFGSQIVPTTATAHCFRVANLLNNFRGINFIGGRCAIVTCGPTRYPLIWTAWSGSLGTLVYEGVNAYTDCYFQGQSGPSIYTDTTLENWDAASSAIITRASIITFRFAWVNQDDVTIRDSYIQIDQSGGFWVPQAVDDNGNILPAFFSMNQLKVHECELVPVGHSGLSGLTSCWMAGFGQFKCDHSRFGGESTMVIMRCTTSKYKYNGVTPSSLYNPQGQQPAIHFESCAMASADEINWMEIYDTFPLYIDVRNFSPSTDGPGTPPNPRVLLMQSLGIWIDSTSCPDVELPQEFQRGNPNQAGPVHCGPGFPIPHQYQSGPSPRGSWSDGRNHGAPSLHAGGPSPWPCWGWYPHAWHVSTPLARQKVSAL